jgi:hypothetical protein
MIRITLPDGALREYDQKKPGGVSLLNHNGEDLGQMGVDVVCERFRLEGSVNA